MCRNIKPLFNFDPPATDEEIRSAALQFVRKVTGYNKPSHQNETVFETAVTDIAQVAATLMHGLRTDMQPKNREIEAEKRRTLAAKRFPSSV